MAKGEQFRIGLLEDHVVIREMVASFLSELDEYHIQFSTGDPQDALQACREYPPDVMVVDLGLDEASGLDFLESLNDIHPKPRCMVFSASSDPQNVQLALKRGALGFVEKSASTDEFLSGLRAVAHGRLHFPLSLLPSMVVCE